MSHNTNRPFTTKDRNNHGPDAYHRNCAVFEHGGWWYWACTNANLNGQYYGDGRDVFGSVFWWQWKGSRYSLKRTEMKIRPIS